RRTRCRSPRSRWPTRSSWPARSTPRTRGSGPSGRPRRRGRTSRAGGSTTSGSPTSWPARWTRYRRCGAVRGTGRASRWRRSARRIAGRAASRRTSTAERVGRAGKAQPDGRPADGGPVIALVIDDSHTMRRIVRRIVAQLGFDVYEAENGKEAIDLLAELPTVPAVALVDWNMPVMDGLEFIRQVRQLPDLRGM